MKLINKSGFINFWIRKKLLKFAINICKKKRNKTEIKSGYEVNILEAIN